MGGSARRKTAARTAPGKSKHERLTGIPIPVEVLAGLAVTLVVEAELRLRRAVCKGDVVVGNVVEEVDLVLWKQQAGGNRVHGRVAPALVEEAAIAVERGKEVDVGVAAQPVEVANLKVGPLWTVSESGERWGGKTGSSLQSGSGCTSCPCRR